MYFDWRAGAASSQWIGFDGTSSPVQRKSVGSVTSSTEHAFRVFGGGIFVITRSCMPGGTPNSRGERITADSGLAEAELGRSSAAAGDIDVAFIGCDAPRIAAAIFRIANRQSKPLITLSNDLHCL